MKILAIGLDGAVPELLFEDERLENIRRIMDAGCFGPLESVEPPTTIPAWLCMATSQDPGTLGVYGIHDRLDRSYNAADSVATRTITAPTLWDHIARDGKKSITVGVPACFAPRAGSGMSVGCFLTPNPGGDASACPESLRHEIENLVGHYPVDVRSLRTQSREALRDEIWSMTRTHFQVVRHLIRNHAWDYFQCVEIGVDRVQRAFWPDLDTEHRRHTPGSPFAETIRDYYRLLDEEIGTLLEGLDEDTAVLVVSARGAQRLDGSFCVNEWLAREGLLVLNAPPDRATPFHRLSINWEKTRAWSEGGECARMYINVRGREPQGVVGADELEAFREDIKARLEATTDSDGQLLGTKVFKPHEIYREARNVAPDLLVNFGDLRWNAVGDVGYGAIQLPAGEDAPDGCNVSRQGAFILASPALPPIGVVEGVKLIDIAPTVLELMGQSIPDTMQGRSFLEGALRAQMAKSASTEEEDLIRERLSGLGYI